MRRRPTTATVVVVVVDGESRKGLKCRQRKEKKKKKSAFGERGEKNSKQKQSSKKSVAKTQVCAVVSGEKVAGKKPFEPPCPSSLPHPTPETVIKDPDSGKPDGGKRKEGKKGKSFFFVFVSRFSQSRPAFFFFRRRLLSQTWPEK